MHGFLPHWSSALSDRWSTENHAGTVAEPLEQRAVRTPLCTKNRTNVTYCNMKKMLNPAANKQRPLKWPYVLLIGFSLYCILWCLRVVWIYISRTLRAFILSSKLEIGWDNNVKHVWRSTKWAITWRWVSHLLFTFIWPWVKKIHLMWLTLAPCVITLVFREGRGEGRGRCNIVLKGFSYFQSNIIVKKKSSIF